ncbi:MAG TPA: DHH family phosphoesterase [Bacillota bacterium]|nr:DHH family phosphoesterase [Bacillota bacterium]
MNLAQFNGYHDIVIQCHDYPDADALASGFGLYRYFATQNKNVRLVYSGKAPIQKSNLVMMVQELQIPVEYVQELQPEPELLITVDCQYGEGNVTRLSAKQVAVIDHHEQCQAAGEWTEIKSSYGSCATLVYSLLSEAGFPVNAYRELATALYYGLYMDTDGFGEIRHPRDLDLIEDLKVNTLLLEQLKNSNFSLAELETAGIALLRHTYDETHRFALFRANPCDANILGFISDLVLQVDRIDVCVVYNEQEYGYKLSVRSCRRDATANDLARYLTWQLGNGGGHKQKAGGFIIKSKFAVLHPNTGIDRYLLNGVNSYFNSYEVIDTTKITVDTTAMLQYRKLSIPQAYVCSGDLAKPGTALTLRTLEGDVGIVADAEIYIMIGISGEVYPIRKAKFEASYQTVDTPYKLEAEYPPVARNRMTDEIYPLIQFARSCVAVGTTPVWARPLQRSTKLFSKWDYDHYMLGQPGDYLAVRCDDVSDAYIIQKLIFETIYTRSDDSTAKEAYLNN